MYTIRVTGQTKEGLPRTMFYAIRSARALGNLDGLIHAKDDVIRELKHGFEMTSCWDTPKEVDNVG